MSDVFLSYKSEDREIAHKIAEVIEQKGYSVWVDRIIPPGKEFYKVIKKEIDAASCVVVLWSNRSIESIDVKTEAKAGFAREILIPVLIENVKPPFEFTLIEAANLVEWDGTSSYHEFQLILESIRDKLGSPQVSETKFLKTPEQEVEEIKGEKPIHEYMQERMVEIPNGTFIMGDDSYGRREVTISAFQIDKFPVTQYIYEMVMDDNPSHFEGKDQPVENVTWFDAIKFCNELSKNVGLQKAYEVNGKTVERKVESDGYRLPTEAEWEYACRANTTGERYGKLDEIACYKTNETQPVKRKTKNEFGLYDMLGNVKEWCFDRYGDYPKKPETDPTGPDTGPTRIMRGGSFLSHNNEIRCPHRNGDWPNTFAKNIGFRLVLPLNQRVAKE